MKKVLENNNIVYIPDDCVDEVNINFKKDAKNNIVFIGEYAKLYKTNIRLNGSGNVVYIAGYESKEKKDVAPFLRITLDLYENSSFYLGKNSTIKTKTQFRGIIAKDTNIFLGNDVMMSEGTLMRTTDAHYVYNLDLYEPINLNKSIMIGDHVWIAADVTIFKGTIIGSGSIVSGNALLVGNKIFCSNAVIGGMPAKTINTNVAWLRPEVHKKQEHKSKEEIDEFKYNEDEKTISLQELDKKIIESTEGEKLKMFNELDENKNRFCIEYDSKKKKENLEIKNNKNISLKIDKSIYHKISSIEIEDLYWENTYLNIILNKDVDYLVLYRKKNDEKIKMIKVNECHFKINVVNVDTESKVLYGEYFVLYKGLPLNVSKELIKNMKTKEKIFLFSKKYAYLAFYKRSNYILKINFQTYENIELKKVIKPKMPKKFKGKVKRVLANISKKYMQILYNIYHRTTPNKEKNVLFLTMNKDVIDGNLIALYDYMKENTDYNLITEAHNIFKMKKKDKIKNVLRTIKKIAKSKYIFVDNYTPIFNRIDLPKDVELIQLWHAGVGFKAVGYTRFGKTGSPNLLNSAHRKYTRAIASTSKAVEIYQDVFGISADKFIITGLPRLDKLVGSKEEIEQKIYKKYPKLKDKKNILFVPTYRGKGQSVARYDINWLNLDKINEFCENNNMNFIIKMHPFVDPLEIDLKKYSNILDLSDYQEMNELLCISSAMITDFSSNVYEAALLEIPIILFAPDKEEYEVTRGVHRTLDEFAGDDIARNTEELLESLKDLKIKDWQKDFRKDEVQLEHSGSCKKIVEEIFKK